MFATSVAAARGGDNVADIGLVSPADPDEVPALPGCERFSPARKAQLRAQIARRVTSRLKRDHSYGVLTIVYGCSIAGTSVVSADWNILDAKAPRQSEDFVTLEDAIFEVTNDSVILRDTLRRSAVEDGYLKLTSAGDLDADGRLDYVYVKRARKGPGFRSTTIVVFGNGRSSHLANPNDQPFVLFELDGSRGVVGEIAEEFIGDSRGWTRKERRWVAYRLAKHNLGSDPALAKRLGSLVGR
jgi:hypothetical protein